MKNCEDWRSRNVLILTRKGFQYKLYVYFDCKVPFCDKASKPCIILLDKPNGEPFLKNNGYSPRMVSDRLLVELLTYVSTCKIYLNFADEEGIVNGGEEEDEKEGTDYGP